MLTFRRPGTTGLPIFSLPAKVAENQTAKGNHTENWRCLLTISTAIFACFNPKLNTVSTERGTAYVSLDQ